MSKHNVFRDGKIHVCKERCATCIFRPGNIMDLAPGRVKQMVDDATKKDTAIICHSTLEADNAVCRGFFDQYETMPLRLARAMAVVEYVDVVKE